MRHKAVLIIVAVLLPLSMAAAAVAIYFWQSSGGDLPPSQSKVKVFQNSEEFQQYLAKSRELTNGSFFGNRNVLESAVDSMDDSGAPSAAPSKDSGSPERGSSTNVQVSGIDEPDYVKTDIENGIIYLSEESRYYMYDAGVDIAAPDYIIPPEQQKIDTKIVKAFPPAKMALLSKIDDSGEMLLSGKHLIFIKPNEITSYNTDSGKQEWEATLEDLVSYNSARLYDETLYLVTSTYLGNTDDGCPVPLMHDSADKAAKAQISCTDIYYSPTLNENPTLYSVSKIDIEDGTVTDTVSFVGNSYSSVVYMSEQNIYLAFENNTDFFIQLSDFISQNKSLFNETFRTKVENLAGYDISYAAKLTELQGLIDTYYRSLDATEKTNFGNEFTNRLQEFSKENSRAYNRTTIMRVGLESFEIEAEGSVAGSIHNQFSIDEYQDNLRVVTTLSPQLSWWGFGIRILSSSLVAPLNNIEENDLYILSENMEEKSSIQGLGLDERIYSARFVGDRGYMVTFKQIDPFFVFDLSDPDNPKLTGELKIPGFSSYLHPINKDLVIGVGSEGAAVKVSLFDSSDPKNPKEVSKMILDDYWTEISSNHHAFTIDSKHKVFFMPGSNKGYVISYDGNRLSAKKVVDGANFRRAVYFDDYLYLIAREEIVVLDENSWSNIKEFSLSD